MPNYTLISGDLVFDLIFSMFGKYLTNNIFIIILYYRPNTDLHFSLVLKNH